MRTQIAVTILFLATFPTFLKGALNETEEQCASRYGKPEVKYYDAKSQKKILFYSHTFSEDIEVVFLNGIATEVTYHGALSEAKITTYLGLNAQGHKWSLTKLGEGPGGHTYRTYTRDDGALAGWVYVNGDQILAFLPPPPTPTKSKWKFW